MTSDTGALASEPSEWPASDTAVLLDRPLNPAQPQAISVFADDLWDLTPGLFEAHTHSYRLDFATVPDPFKHAAKHYVWQLINRGWQKHPAGSGQRRLALRSIAHALTRLTAFLHWTHARGLTRLTDVTLQDLDAYVADVAGWETRADHRSGLLIEVRRFWSYRLLLPAYARLPEAPPWDGEKPADLIGGAKRPRENRTPRIAADTMRALLMWSLRFIDNFADDIIDAHREYVRLRGRSTRTRHRDRRRPADRMEPAQREAALRAWLHRLEQAGTGLPSRSGPGGQREIDWPHVGRLFDLDYYALQPGRRLRTLVEDAGLPLGGPATLDSTPHGLLHGRCWRASPIGYREAPQLARLLRAAALVVIAYLTGMRAGEVLNLERGCIRQDPGSHLWMITGQHWKGARDANGNQIPQGLQRPDPWTTVKPVAEAIAVLERLHPHPLLFSTDLNSTDQPRPEPRQAGQRRITRHGRGRTGSEFSSDITALINWVNHYADERELAAERIPGDPHGAISPSRFRRTLAWHIVRRPRGLIAGAIQYGHLHVQITLGYAGTYDSGFPDEHAYEDWLSRLDALADNHQRLTIGEHVTGPAADTYRHRVTAAQQQFAGRVLTTSRQARDLVANPLLQIYPGRGMTCVFNPAKALCQLVPAEHDARRTPDHDDCRPNCRNIAYTDRDIAEVRRRTAELQELVADRLAPSIRNQRERAELDRLQAIIRRHDHGK